MINTYPQVMMIDCTFKTNRYDMPLLEAVGATSTDKTFTMAYAFMGGEETNNYVYVLQFIRSLFVTLPFPGVIVTDRELALINAVEIVFPESRHHLCQRHIEVCVLAKALAHPGFDNAFAEGFKFNWNWLISAKTEDQFDERWADISENYKPFPALLRYCANTWINPYRNAICSYIIDQYLHYGSYTTNRVEGEHHRVKRNLDSSTLAFDTVLDKLDAVMASQVTEIKKASRFSATKLSTNDTYGNLFDELNRRITLKAINLIKKELNVVQRRGDNSQMCGCHQRRVMGLPCACELHMYINSNQSIPINRIDDYWRQIYVRFTEVDEVEPSRADEDLHVSSTHVQIPFTIATEDLSAPPVVSRSKGKNKWGIRMPSGFERVMKAVGFTPSESKRGQGRVSSKSATQGSAMSISKESGPIPSRMSTGTLGDGQNTPTSRLGRSASTSFHTRTIKSMFKADFPPYMFSHIETLTNVDSDGNCGFRAVAVWMYGNEEYWTNVRHEMLEHLIEKKDMFAGLLGGSKEYVDALYRRINWFKSPAPMDHWFTMPDCGQIVSSLYNVNVMSFSTVGGLTCLPGFVDPNRGPPQRTIALGNVSNRTHWVLLHMTNDEFPVPTINLLWRYHHEHSAYGLDFPLMDRQEQYEILHSTYMNK